MTVSPKRIYATSQFDCQIPYKESPLQLEANPENLKKCLQSDPLVHPFRFEFLQECDGSDYGYPHYSRIYSPLECAIVLNDLESVQTLVSHRSCKPKHCESAVLFYISRLKKEEKPPLEILKCLLNQIPDINQIEICKTSHSTTVFEEGKTQDLVDVLATWNNYHPQAIERLFRERTGERVIERRMNVLDYAVFCMSDFKTLHMDVIEELFKKGALVTRISGETPFEHLKDSDPFLSNTCFLKLFVADEDKEELSPDDLLKVNNRPELKLSRLLDYIKIEAKYDPHAGSFLTLEEFKNELYMLKSLFKCMKWIFQFRDSKTKPVYFGIKTLKQDELFISDSSESAEDDSSSELDWCGLKVKLEPETESTETSNSSERAAWTEWEWYNLTMQPEEGRFILPLLHQTLSNFCTFFEAFVKEGTFDDCFSQKEIKNYTALLDQITKAHRIDPRKLDDAFADEILFSRYAGFEKV